MNRKETPMIDPECSGSIEPILEILEGKWTLLLLRDLFNGIKRFGELRRSLHPISPKTLTDRLRMLEEQGIVTRTIYSEVPLHVEYQLTERGQRLQPIFAAMMAWAQSEDSGPKNEQRHSQRSG
jgi:DNA-binding HxlR family transcriptional regulator